jgi:hypothetical protein
MYAFFSPVPSFTNVSKNVKKSSPCILYNSFFVKGMQLIAQYTLAYYWRLPFKRKKVQIKGRDQ